MKKNRIINSVSLFAIFIGIIFVIYLPKEAKSVPASGNPTVFVHGFKGTHNSFGRLLDRFEYKYNWGNKALVYRVNEAGRLQVYNLNKGKKEPVFVQVVFDDARASMTDTSRWLASVLAHMKSVYEIDTVNLVGHSMGGLVSLKYIVERADRTHFPEVEKLITIGSPFDGVYNKLYFNRNWGKALVDLQPGSRALDRLRKRKESVPDALQVLSIGSTGDAVAVPESVQTLKRIINKDQLTEIMIADRTLGHSEMHEDMRVDKLIHDFLAEPLAEVRH
ncbi:alpha/beta hydrolase [Virgibacillus kekensis]|uniref:Alpha/beta hydrolase n=1 Tax=Virgibacillus kekensis TaxID=202261 RepID=A0ABV9DP57_9BACI